MKPKQFSIFTRIGILFFAVITILCLLFMGITYLSVSNFHEASTQLLNKEVAGHIAKFTSPFKENGIDEKKADSVFYDAMVLSPSAEVYFLDTAGNVVAYHINENKIRLKKIDLTRIKKLIAAQGNIYIKGPDPRDPLDPKIFSASEVWNKDKHLGYIYVILGSNKEVNSMLFSTYFNGLIIKVVTAIIIFSIIFAFIYIRRFQKKYNSMLVIFDRFQQGDFKARFPVKVHDEMAPVTTAFNAMADLLVVNIEKLTKTGKERKDFVANISHDLRTPLSVARGYTETLLMKKEQQIASPEQEEFLQLVYRKIRQVEDMVKQLFDLSKMESVEFAPKKEPFIFSEILQEILHESLPVAQEKNIKLDTSGIENSSWIIADVGMIERLIQNLVVNALKYTPEHGFIFASVTAHQNVILFNLSNSGKPFRQEVIAWFNNSQEDIFTNRPTGMGLGLVIVKRILQLHNLQYKLHINEAGLNAFNIYIPVRDNLS